MTPRITGTAAAAIAAALLLSSCTAAPVNEPGGQGPLPTSSAAPPPSATFHPDQPDVHDTQDLVDAPEAGADSEAAAIAAAERVVSAFARPTFAETQWWNELLPLLSQTGAHAYEGTLPENIPASAVTGPPTLVDGATDVIALVEVPSDAGMYIVTLTRSDATQPWLAERIRPAQG